MKWELKSTVKNAYELRKLLVKKQENQNLIQERKTMTLWKSRLLTVSCFQGQLQDLLAAHNIVCTCWGVTFTLAEKKGQFHSDSGKS